MQSVATDRKTCRTCRESKPLDDFAKSGDGRGGRRGECRACKAIWDRSYLLKRRFGITVEMYDAMLADQGGRCAICASSEPSGRWELFAVDHDHETGRVRGLLCVRCNLGLGSFLDRPDFLRSAIAYLGETAA